MGGKYCHENGQAQLADDFLVCLEAQRAVLYDLDKIIQKANSAKAQGNEHGEDGKAIGLAGKQQGRTQAADEKNQPADGGGTLFDQMGLRPIVTDALSHF